jgi:RND family efflux transporter MFP subunit
METSEPQTFDLDEDESPSSSSETSSKSRRPRQPWLWLLLALLFVGGGFALGRRVLTPANEAPSPTAAQELPPRPVETVALTQGNGVRRISLLGQVEASKSATVRTQTAGIVERVLVEVGDRALPGMTVAILDDADQRLALAEAQAEFAQDKSELARLEVGTRQEIIAQRQAELRSAQAREQEARENLERYSELVAAGAITRRALLEERAAADATRGERLQAEAALAEATAGPTREEIDAQRARVAAAGAAVNQARLTLERTRVTAMAGGVVHSREVSTGDLVQSGDPVLNLVNDSDLDVFLELPEELSGSVTPGLPVELTARTLPNWRGRATISGVVPAANAASRRQMVRVRLGDPPEDLLPKMAIQGELQLRVDSPSFVVPRDALTRRGEKWLVHTVESGKAKEFAVELVADMGEKMAISSDALQVGQPVVVRGGDALADGAAVQVTERNISPQNSNN